MFLSIMIKHCWLLKRNTGGIESVEDFALIFVGEYI